MILLISKVKEMNNMKMKIENNLKFEDIFECGLGEKGEILVWTREAERVKL
jgi:hypothetical protein